MAMTVTLTRSAANQRGSRPRIRLRSPAASATVLFRPSSIDVRPSCRSGSVMAWTSAEPHLDVHIGQGGLGQRLEPGGSGRQDLVDLVGLGDQLQVALAGRRVVRDDSLGQQALGVDAARSGGPLALPDLLVVGAEMAMELAHVAHGRPARIGPQD